MCLVSNSKIILYFDIAVCFYIAQYDRPNVSSGENPIGTLPIRSNIMGQEQISLFLDAIKITKDLCC